MRGPALQGRVHGGQNPITLAKVYLYAVATSGYGEPSTSLLNSPGYVTTDSDGNFSITSDYSCTAGQQVYIYANDGNPGLAGGTNNTSAGLLAGLGSCGALQTSLPFIFVDEVSTVATAYALAGYAIDATHISSSSSTLATTGVANAFASITNLETLGTGIALATTPVANGGTGTVPQTEINTLANILAACINTTGSTVSGQPCNTLFTNALSGGTTGTPPTDTATAAINIAHNPGANISNLIALQGSSPPFVPDLSASPAPNDFTIAISYSEASLNQPDDIAVDSSGNVWVGNENAADLTEYSPVGYPLSGAGGYTGGGLGDPYGVAIDPSGFVWVANTDNSLSKFNPNGTPASSTAFTGGGLNQISDMAIDASGFIWLTNFGNNTVSKFNSSGTPVSATGFTGSQLDEPNGIAFDLSGNAWVGNFASGDPSNSSISEFNSSGVLNINSPFSGGGINQPEGIAFDPSGNLWAANNLDPGTISEFTPSSNGGTWAPSAFSGGGLNLPVALSFDGAGNMWITNSGGGGTAGGLSEFSSTGAAISPANGFVCGCFAIPGLLAIDGSGNVWVTNPNQGDSNAPANGSVVEFVGAAAPVVTPVVANLLTPYGSKIVNEP